MNIEQLQKFCAKGEFRSFMLKPWLHGDYAFATNGHIALRVPADGFLSVVAGGNGSEPNVSKLVDKAKAFYLPMMSIPELVPPEVCEHCAGTGTAYDCDPCDGEGWFDHHGKEYECKWCNGAGQHQNGEGDPSYCWHCDGIGEKRYIQVAVGNSHFDRRYLALIAALPNAKIAPNGPAAITYFAFDGGDGALMPMRVDPQSVAVAQTAVHATANFPHDDMGSEVAA